MSKFVLTAQLQLQAPNNVSQIVSQIQNQLNNVSVNVKVQGSAQANKQLQQITQSTNAATTAAGRMGNAFAVSIRRFAAFSIATRAVGLFTSTLADAVKTAIDFERELIKISQVTGRSVSSLRDLTDSVTSLATGLGVTSGSLLEVTTVLTQAGLSSEDTKIALESLARAALAPNFDSITETAEGAIAILAQFKQGVGALEGQLSSIDAVAGAFAVEAGDLIDVIRRSGGVFKASGGSLNELLALFTSVRATTRESAESIGTGLRTIFTRIQRPETIEFLKQFGVELVDLNGKFVGPYEAIRRLSEAISGLGEGDLTFIKIAEELGGFRQIGKVLPLLQQFSTAQAALNVAQNAGNGLAKNAETAQASLAIRIIKVREEFLALVRSMTETSTFQVMANTALALASALIKIADSIKPLLPLLGAVAAFKAVKGIGGFIGGIGSGLTSGKTFNNGGKVLAFAKGGLVPGSGSGTADDIPAMVSSGEFVMKKSAVQRIGANNLAQMNNGGTVQKFVADGVADKIAKARSQPLSANPNKEKTKTYEDGQTKPISFSVADGNIGAFFMNKEGTADGLKSFKKQKFNITNEKILSLSGISPKEVKPTDSRGKTLPRMSGEKRKFTANGVLEAGKIATFYPSLTDVRQGSLGSIVESNVKQKLSEAVLETANFISSNKLLNIPPIIANDSLIKQRAANRIQSDAGAIKTTAGYLFEGVIDAITGAKPASANAVFDFPSSSLVGNRGRLGALFGNTSGIQNVKQADAKASYSPSIIDGEKSGNITSKIINSINQGVLSGVKVNTQKKQLGGIIQKFAVGGLAKQKDTLQRYFEDAAPMNLGLSGSKALSKDQRKQLASDTRDLRQLRTSAPTQLYSSISRTAFDKFAMNTGLNKNPNIPKDTKYNDRQKYFSQEVAKIVGKTFSLPGFVSTSKDYTVAKSFLDNAPRSEDNWAAMLTIATKKNAQGVDVAKQLKDRKINVTKQDINPRTGQMDTFFMKQPSEENEFMLSPRSRFRVNTAKYVDLMGRHNLWANVQQFAAGGRAKGIEGAPLVDDILQASGSILPRPSAAIQALIKAGGGAVDVDRTLKRTVGDTAYAKAPTPGAKNASLDTYFRDEAKRLQDLRTAPITQFGKELQVAIKSGQLDARKISIISKSKRVKGAAEYLSSQFGIPVQNMVFTQGASKQPAIDAIRNKGSRIERVKRFLGGIIPQRFALGGMGKPSRKVDYESGVGPSPFASQKSNKLGQEVYALQKSSGLNNLEFGDIVQTANTLGYNTIPQFKQYLAKRVAEKKSKSQLKTNVPSLLNSLKDDQRPQTTLAQAAMVQQLSGPEPTPQITKLSPQAEKMRIMLGGKPKAFASGGLVPGVGNSDTVPATLQEGDFVIRKSSVSKLGVENLASMAGYAAGGNVSKSVPALLTPGEFVFDEPTAKSIGYGNLNRMNKVGKYAKGGVVQRFAQGSSGTGVQPPSTGSGQNFVPLAMLTKQAQTLAQAQQAQTQTTQQATQTTQSNTDAVEQNGLSFMAATIGLGAIQSAFAALTPVIDENSTAFEKVTASVLNSVSGLVNTIGIAIIALQQLNIQITLATTKMIAQNAFDFLSGAKSLTQIFDIAKGGIPGLQNFTKSFKGALAGMPRNIPARAAGTVAGNVARAGNFAGTALNKVTGGTGTFAGTRNLVNNTNLAQNINKVPARLTNGFKFGYGSSQAGFDASGASQYVQQFMKQNTSAGPVSRFATGLSARAGSYASSVADSGLGQTVGKAANATKQFVGGQLSNSPIANFVGKAGSNAIAGFKGGLAGKAIIGGGSTSIAGNAGGFAGKGLNIAGNAISGFTKSLSSSVTKITTGLNAAAGPLLAIQIATSLASAAINSFFDYQNQANKAIEEGNSAKAAEMSINAAVQDSIDSFGSSAILAGAAIGSLVPGVGTVVGGLVGAGVALSAKFIPSLLKSSASAVDWISSFSSVTGLDFSGLSAGIRSLEEGFNRVAIGAGTLFGGNTYDSIKSLAIAQAEGVKAQKALNEAGEKVTAAMNDLQAGTISAAQAVAANAAQASQVGKSVEANKKASEDNEKNKSGMVGGFLRGAARVGTLGLAGYMGLESGAQRNARIDTENKGRSQTSTKMQEDLIAKSTPAINAFSADVAAAGGSFQDVLASMNDSTSAAFNPALYQALIQQGTGPLQKAFDNIKKEVERAQKAFNAMNLGMQNVQGAAAAAALGVNNYIASQQAGNVGLEQSLAVLEASVTSAAQGISDADFGKALSDADATLASFGASKEQREKFSGNISAVNEVQKNQSTIFAGAKDKLAADIRKSNSADERKKIFSQSVDDQLKASGYDEETRKRFKDATGNMSDDQLKKIGEGDFTAFEESINELGKKTMEQVSGPLKAAIEIQKQLNELTKQRIEAERQLVSAQLEASNVRMEAMEISAQYGGPKVTPEMRAQNIAQQANIQSRGITGVTDIKTGSAQELSTRTQQLRTRQAEISDIRMKAARGDSAAQQQLQGEGGLKLQEEEKKIQDAAKSQVQATRDLIKSKQEELKIIKEKNQLEKSSIDALVSGDIEKFFDQQAAVGAQAAIATGDQRLIGQFGMSALGGAAQETKRQQEAGVQTLYGQQLSGPGGLTERAYGSAISAAGVQNPLAMAQVAAGSTGAEIAVESDIRDLAATMGPAADVQVDAANTQVIAAQMQLDAARAKGQEAVAQMQARQMATGGVVYANRGIFVPRGTDTVPAMLTPGEFVVRREAVQRSNNLSILQAMNKGVSTSAPAASSQSGGVAAMASGGIVRYRAEGSTGPEAGGSGMSAEALNAFAAALSQFNTELTKNIKTLSDTKFQVSLSPTDINVNLNGASFLANLTSSIKQDLLKFLGQEISNYSVGNDGKLRKSGSTLGTVT